MKKLQGMATYTGIIFDPLHPEEDKIKTEDIAHALSLLCRANGHASHFYSVAQHSLYCAREARARDYSPRVQLGALLHDASEAYLSDIVRPVKHRLEDYQTIEARLQKTIFKVYGLGDLRQEEINLIREIDDAMLAYELEYLLKQRVDTPIKLVGNYDLSFQHMDKVKAIFINSVEKLQEEVFFYHQNRKVSSNQ